MTEEGKEEYGQSTGPLSTYLCDEIARFFNQIVILKGINYSFIREPAKLRKEHNILEDGRNVINVLYSLFLKNNNKLPDRLKQILSYIFNDTTLLFDLTQDGRILLRLFEKYASGRQLELAAPGISDGFYKVLTILTALESEPSLLMIDELENSLHAEALELIVDELKSSHFMIIITTHSPVVVDIAAPEDLILVSKGDEGSIFERTKNPEKIREELTKAKITLSERWLYGKL
jgi:predicted ATPase